MPPLSFASCTPPLPFASWLLRRLATLSRPLLRLCPTFHAAAASRPLVVACCKSNDETTKARRYRFLKQSEEHETYLLPGTKEKPIVQVDSGRNYYPTSFKLLLPALLSKNHNKVLPGTSLFHPEASVNKPNQVKG